MVTSGGGLGETGGARRVEGMTVSGGGEGALWCRLSGGAGFLYGLDEP